MLFCMRRTFVAGSILKSQRARNARRPRVESLEIRSLLATTFTGNVTADFPSGNQGIVVISDTGNGGVVHPLIPTNLQSLVKVSGFDISGIAASYDSSSDILSVGLIQPSSGNLSNGVNYAVIAGDSDNNGDSGTVSPSVLAVSPGFQDPSGMGGSKTMGAFLNFSGSTANPLNPSQSYYAPDFVAGFGNSGSPSVPKHYEVASVIGNGPLAIPSFGAEIASSEGNYSLINDPKHGAFEFELKQFSQLYQSVTHQPLTLQSVVHIGAFGESGQDGGISEAFFPAQALSIGQATQPTTPVNLPPTLVLPAARQSAFEGKLLTFQATSTDPNNGQTLTYSLDPGAPAGASINPKTGIFTWTPDASSKSGNITIRVTDNGSPPLSATVTFLVAIASKDTGPPSYKPSDFLGNQSLYDQTVPIQGDYVSGGVGLRTGLKSATQGSILIQGIPDGSTVQAAFLYYGYNANQLKDVYSDSKPISLGAQSPFSKNISFTTYKTGSITQILPSPASMSNPVANSHNHDTDWGLRYAFGFRIDVTDVVRQSGNATYVIKGIQGGRSVLAEGASLIVIYSNPQLPYRRVIIQEQPTVVRLTDAGTSNDAGQTSNGAYYIPLKGLDLRNGFSEKTTFIVGDGQPDTNRPDHTKNRGKNADTGIVSVGATSYGETTLVWGGVPGELPLHDQFQGRGDDNSKTGGHFWDTRSYSVTRTLDWILQHGGSGRDLSNVNDAFSASITFSRASRATKTSPARPQEGDSLMWLAQAFSIGPQVQTPPPQTNQPIVTLSIQKPQVTLGDSLGFAVTVANLRASRLIYGLEVKRPSESDWTPIISTSHNIFTIRPRLGGVFQTRAYIQVNGVRYFSENSSSSQLEVDFPGADRILAGAINGPRGRVPLNAYLASIGQKAMHGLLKANEGVPISGVHKLQEAACFIVMDTTLAPDTYIIPNLAVKDSPVLLNGDESHAEVTPPNYTEPLKLYDTRLFTTGVRYAVADFHTHPTQLFNPNNSPVGPSERDIRIVAAEHLIGLVYDYQSTQYLYQRPLGTPFLVPHGLSDSYYAYLFATGAVRFPYGVEPHHTGPADFYKFGDPKPTPQ